MYIFLYHHFIGKESEPQRQAVTCPGKHSKYNLYPEIELKSLPQRPFSSLKSQCQFSKLLLDSRIVILGIWALRSYWFIYLSLASFQNCLWDLEEAWTVTQSSTHNNVPSAADQCVAISLKNSETFTPTDTEKEGHVSRKEIPENAIQTFYLLPYGYSRINPGFHPTPHVLYWLVITDRSLVSLSHFYHLIKGK